MNIHNGIKEIIRENTEYVIKYILKTPPLKKRLEGKKVGGFQLEAFRWAREHNDEFGDPKDSRLTTELYDVDWEEVWEKTK